MRAQLIAYLADADDKKIMGLYALLEDNIQEKASSGLTKEQLSFLNEERKKHLNGESISRSWEEVKDLIRQKNFLMFRLIVKPAVHQMLDDAYWWYEEQVPGLGERFKGN